MGILQQALQQFKPLNPISSFKEGQDLAHNRKVGQFNFNQAQQKAAARDSFYYVQDALAAGDPAKADAFLELGINQSKNNGFEPGRLVLEKIKAIEDPEEKTKAMQRYIEVGQTRGFLQAPPKPAEDPAFIKYAKFATDDPEEQKQIVKNYLERQANQGSTQTEYKLVRGSRIQDKDGNPAIHGVFFDKATGKTLERIVPLPKGGDFTDTQGETAEEEMRTKVRTAAQIAQKATAAELDVRIEKEPELEEKKTMVKEFAKNNTEFLFEKRSQASDARKTLNSITRAQQLLDGGAITGFGANWILGMGKALQRVGINVAEDAIANTEAFAAAQAIQVAQIIKNFGAGTGLSDADRVFAQKAAGQEITMTEASIRRILEINSQVAKEAIDTYNESVSEYGKGAKIALPENFKSNYVPYGWDGQKGTPGSYADRPKSGPAPTATKPKIIRFDAQGNRI